MKASVGDRIVLASNKVDGPVRDGTIVELRHRDGTPPYVVRWADTGQTGLVFPGPDAHVEHLPSQGATKAEAAVPRHVKRWRIDIDLFEAGDDTTAHLVLVSETPEHLDARGHARRNRTDTDVPEIGDEVAVARALHRLAERLLEEASADISAIEGHQVHLRS